MKPSKSIFVFLALLIAVPFAHASDGSLMGVVNAFLATYAKANIAWKKNIVIGADPKTLPPGTQLGLSKVVGYYSFEPKTWSDLSPAEQSEVITDPRLPAFIVSLREATQAPPGPDGQRMSENGRPLYPVEGVSMQQLAGSSTIIKPKQASISIFLTGEQLVAKEEIQFKAFK